MIHWLAEGDENFPDPNTADAEGIVAIGGNLSHTSILKAYENGIFPWFNPGDPVIWWSPDPRYVIIPSEIKVAKSMRPYLNQNKFQLSFDRCFEKVIAQCQRIFRSGQDGETWITEGMRKAYIDLHKKGYAHSVEVWSDGVLAGGLYGLSLGKCFFGESMFSLQKNASKYGLIRLAQCLEKRGFHMIDCQLRNDHLVRMGAVPMARSKFLSILKENSKENTLLGPWTNLMSD